ncbi:chaplin family protein [Streptomyces sp. NPDC093982]|uniref:chaplin family protein n=1 Tax=Streptomyces sp. NPDC093982 TaxID=3155077 RepID=UPI003418C5B7
MKRLKEIEFVTVLSGGLIALGISLATGYSASAASDPSSLISENQIESPVNAPVNICGITLTVLGSVDPIGACSNTSTRSIPPTIVPVPLIDPIVGGTTAAVTTLGLAEAMVRRRGGVREAAPRDGRPT